MGGHNPTVGNEYILDVDYVTEMSDKVETEGCKSVSEGHRFKLVTSLGDQLYHDYTLMSEEQHGENAPILKVTSDVFGDVLRVP